MFGMGGKVSQMGMKQALKSLTPSENQMFVSLADIISGIEYEQADAIEQCTNTADMDITVQHDREKRREELLAVADSVADQDFRHYWFAEIVDIDRPEQAAKYVDYDGDQWRSQLETWYQQYHEMSIVDAPLANADRADLGHVAAMHVEESFGISLDEFVAGVINGDQGSALETVIAGPIRSYTGAINRLAEEIEKRDQRIEELEARVEELEAET
ncbi:hypothetical protein [Salinibaculum salinum]|uniref:hypothetical protein n=1 Tax=Salinibaculum salinum TaxID=3131996 RepID=UPI0030EB744E